MIELDLLIVGVSEDCAVNCCKVAMIFVDRLAQCLPALLVLVVKVHRALLAVVGHDNVAVF